MSYAFDSVSFNKLFFRLYYIHAEKVHLDESGDKCVETAYGRVCSVGEDVQASLNGVLTDGLDFLPRWAAGEGRMRSSLVARTVLIHDIDSRCAADMLG